MTTLPGDAPAKKRTWFRFSLRSLLVLMLLLSVAAAWFGTEWNRLRRQRAIVSELKSLHVGVFYRVKDVRFTHYESPQLVAPWILRQVFGDDAWSEVGAVNLNTVSQPHEVLRHLSKFPRLDTVTLSGGEIDDEYLQQLTAENYSLGVLNLGKTNVTARGLESLQRSPLCILLLNGEVDDAQLQGVSQLKSLTNLEFPRSQVTSQGLAAVAGLENLQVLCVQDSPHIGNDGLRHLVGLRALTHLNLTNTAVTDAGLKTIGQLKSLTNLHLGSEGITAEGLATLTALPRLSLVRLYPPCTEDQARSLSLVLPNCEILRQE